MKFSLCPLAIDQSGKFKTRRYITHNARTRFQIRRSHAHLWECRVIGHQQETGRTTTSGQSIGASSNGNGRQRELATPGLVKWIVCSTCFPEPNCRSTDPINQLPRNGAMLPHKAAITSLPPLVETWRFALGIRFCQRGNSVHQNKRRRHRVHNGRSLPAKRRRE